MRQIDVKKNRRNSKKSLQKACFIIIFKLKNKSVAFFSKRYKSSLNYSFAKVEVFREMQLKNKKTRKHKCLKPAFFLNFVIGFLNFGKLFLSAFLVDFIHVLQFVWMVLFYHLAVGLFYFCIVRRFFNF